MRAGAGAPAVERVRPLFSCLMVLTFLMLYGGTILGLVTAWAGSESYSHGFLIAPISLYLVWSRRGDILSRKPRPSRAGVPFLGVWAALFILGVGAEISTFERVSMVVFLLGCALALGGREITVILLFPVLFLLFMVPIPSEVYSAFTSPLAIVATTCSAALMHCASIPVFQEGNLIHMPGFTLEVQDVCSGMRSLVAIVALALLVGYRALSSLAGMVILIVLSIPVSLIGNIARITVAGLLSYGFSSRVTDAWAHAAAGVSAFLLSFFLLLGAGGVIRWVEQKRMQYISWSLR